MAAGWSQVFGTPFEYVKQVASDYGGTKVGMAIRWPQGGVPGNGEVRPQFHHVVDVAPTILEAVGLPEPKIVNGTPQRPMDGVSMIYTFKDASAAERHTTQYFEMFGNRAIYHDGWLARTSIGRHGSRSPEVRWKTTPGILFIPSGISVSPTTSQHDSRKLSELQELFMTEAIRNFVLPLDDRTLARAIPALAGRPDLMAGRTSLTLTEGMTGMPENVFLDVKNKSMTITAEVVVPEEGVQGAILVQGGRFGGWALYVKDGVPAYHYNFLNLQRYTIMADRPLPRGKATIRFEFAYDGGGFGKGGTGDCT